MPRTDWGWLITPDELRSWILFEDERVIAINKPGHVVCHPSKHGEMSSLIGAVRMHTGQEDLHMPTRLDRETSGVVVVVKDAETRGWLHKAGLARAIAKTYHAVLVGRLGEAVTVDQPIGLAEDSRVAARRAVRRDGAGQGAVTEFAPLAFDNGHTLVRVTPRTGRTHQIRVHAAWLGHPVAGDKLYPDEQVFLDFIEGRGETATAAGIDRQALHATRWSCESGGTRAPFHFAAPLPAGEWKKLMPGAMNSGTIGDC